MVSLTELSEAIIASLIFAMGLIAIASAALRLPSGDRAPIWFGLFGCLYGVRLAGHSELVQPLFPEVFWRYLDAFIPYTIIVPGGLVFAAYQTLGGEVRLEPLAMLVFMTSVGYLVAQRMLAGERRLVSVSRELDLAREIQQSILPLVLPDIAGLRVAARYLPISNIGGDFYDFDTQRADRLGVIVADVTGHGVPAALVASMVKIAFVAEADRLDTPGAALTNINRTLCGRFAGAYVTACFGVIDRLNGRLSYSSAGHPAPMLRRAMSSGSIDRHDRWWRPLRPLGGTCCSQVSSMEISSRSTRARGACSTDSTPAAQWAAALSLTKQGGNSTSPSPQEVRRTSGWTTIPVLRQLWCSRSPEGAQQAFKTVLGIY